MFAEHCIEISLIFTFVPNMMLFTFDALQPSQVIGTGTFACGSVIAEGRTWLLKILHLRTRLQRYFCIQMFLPHVLFCTLFLYLFIIIMLHLMSEAFEGHGFWSIKWVIYSSYLLELAGSYWLKTILLLYSVVFTLPFFLCSLLYAIYVMNLIIGDNFFVSQFLLEIILSGRIFI